MSTALRRTFATLAILALCLIPASGNLATAKAQEDPVVRTETPLPLFENKGQLAESVDFHLQGTAHEVLIRKSGIQLATYGQNATALGLAFMDANTAGPEGVFQWPNNVRFLFADDPGNPLGGVPAFSGVRYNKLYSGVRAIVEAKIDPDDHFLLRRTLEITDPDVVKGIIFAYPGNRGLSVAEDGSIIVDVGLNPKLGEVKDILKVFQVGGDLQREPIEAVFVLNGDGTAYVEAEGVDSSRPLYIETSLDYTVMMEPYAELLGELSKMPMAPEREVPFSLPARGLEPAPTLAAAIDRAQGGASSGRRIDKPRAADARRADKPARADGLKALVAGRDFGGADLIVAQGDVLSGVFHNVGRFVVPKDVTAFVDAGMPLYIYADDIDVQGTLNGNGLGFAGGIATALRGSQGITGSGPGGGSRGMMGPIVHATGGGGGGHGGAGGAGMTLALPLAAPGGDAYDFEPDQIQMGSGGGSAANHATPSFARGGAGGYGGAGIYLEAENVALSGSILADGTDGQGGVSGDVALAVSGGGGGAGGGILIRGAFTCSATAVLSARGGQGADAVMGAGWATGGGGGAGGRIKLIGSGNLADCETLVAGGAAGAGTPDAFMPATPGGSGGAGSQPGGDAEAAEIALETVAEGGADGSVEAIDGLDQPTNLCATTLFSFSNLTPITILDNTLATSTINVAGTGVFLADIDVTTNIVHTFGSDLDFTVTSPVGTISTLSTDNAGGNDNTFNGTLWDDDANPGSPASAQPQPPINGLAVEQTYTNLVTATPLVAEEALGAFQGQNPNGVWTISIFDDAGGDTGTLTWSIALRTCAAAPSSSLVNASNLVLTAINDNTTNSSTINVAGAPTTIADVNAITNIVHPAGTDLDFSITSPAGTSVTLSTDNGLTNVFNGTTWDDSADPGGPASTQTPNTTSNVVTDRTYTSGVTSTPLVPEEAMAAFIGENPNGIWTIQIFDDTAGNTGTFTWALAIQAFTPGAPPGGQADLSITKATLPAGQTTVIAGNNLTYRVTATNLGPDNTTGVIIEDTLPINTVFVSATPTPGAPDGVCTFTAATRLVSCSWASTMTAGSTRIVDIVVRVCPGVLCNTVLQNSARVRDNNTQLQAQIYRQEFTTTTGDFVLTNDAQPSANWIFANNCTSSTSNLGAGHTTPGTLRWGNPNTCADFGAAATNDLARTPLINTSVCFANLRFTFKYYVNFQEAEPFDEAFVDVGVIVGGTLTRAAALPGAPGGVGQVSLINDFNTVQTAPVWQTATVNVSTLLGSIPPNMLIQFRGNTLDGFGNQGQGYIIDDVTVNCDRAGDPNPNNNSTILNTTVQTQSQFQTTKTADRREVPTGNQVTYTIVSRNLGPSNANGMVVRDVLPPNFTFVAATTSRGTCTAATPQGSTQTVVTCNVGVLGAPAALQAGCVTPALPDTVTITIRALTATNVSEATVDCPEGLVSDTVTVTTTNCLPDTGVTSATAATCVVPKVNPNAQLGGQVHLPILNFQGQDDVCESMIEVQFLGCIPAKAVLVTWGEPGFCPPQAAGPLKVECTGLLVPGASWIMQDAQIPTGSKSGILFMFTAQQLSDVNLDDDLGFDDVVADLMCEELFFGVVGDADDYRRFKKAYNEGVTFRGIPQNIAKGEGVLAVEVLRRCPGDLTPGVDVTGKYNGVAGDHLGKFDPIFGGFAYYVPLVYGDKGGLNTVMYIQNGGLECSSLEIWFKAQDDCLRARICDVTTVAPGESYQFDATDCVGQDWQGSAWIRSSEPLGIAVDIFGRDIMMTYVAEPAPFNYIFTIEDNPDFKLSRPGNQVLFGPLIYSEYQGWDTGIQVQNLDPTKAAKVKVYFLDRSGDIITTLVDWICPRGSQTYFLPVVAKLPGSWVGSVRVESQEWWNAGSAVIEAPSVVGVAQLIKYSDVARTTSDQAIAYSLLPEHKAYNWQVGFADGGLDQGVGLIAIPSLLKDLDGDGVTSEVAIMNLAEKPGFTDFAIFIYDQNGLLDFVCQKLHDRQVEYIDLQTWGYVGAGFRGSAIISATFWEHDVFNPTGEFVRNLVGLGAVSVERTNTRLGTEVPGDEAAGDRGIPFRNDANLQFCFPEGFVPKCPGQPAFP